MKIIDRPPPVERLDEALGSASVRWAKLIDAIGADFAPVIQEWKPTKLPFGAVCLLKQRARTLAYLIPGERQFEVSIVLGERAVVLALASDLPEKIKTLIQEAKAYVEGRGVRFVVASEKDVAAAVALVRCKTTPK